MYSLGVERLGLGLAALGRPGYINLDHGADLDGDYSVESMERRAHSVLDTAYNHGIRYFDAARSYGKAEQFLSTWIVRRRLLPDDVVVGSKWGYKYTADWKVDAEVHEEKEHSLDRFRNQWLESFSVLGEYISLYQIHSATLESGVLENPDVLKALVELKSAGVQIGASVSGPRQSDVILRLLETTVDGVSLFDSVQATWNLLEQSCGPALRLAHDKGLRTIIKESLANGRLTDRGQSETVTQLRRAAKNMGIAIDALALAAVLFQMPADTVLLGAAKSEHVRSNLEALTVDVDEIDFTALNSDVEDPEVYWKKRSQLEWN